jgi:hypothetical protein
LRAEILAEVGQVDGDDYQIVSDTLDGASDLPEIVGEFLREAIRRDAYAEAIDAIIDDARARKKRHGEAASRLRQIVREAMEQAGEKKLTLPDMTVSIVPGRAKVIITGEVPREFCRVKEIVEPDKAKIAEALADPHGFVEFASMSNPEPVLSIRSK